MSSPVNSKAASVSRGRPSDRRSWREARSRRTQSEDVAGKMTSSCLGNSDDIVESTLKEIRGRKLVKEDRTRMSHDEIDQILANIRRSRSQSVSRPPPPSASPPSLPSEDDDEAEVLCSFLPFGKSVHGSKKNKKECQRRRSKTPYRDGPRDKLARNRVDSRNISPPPKDNLWQDQSTSAHFDDYDLPTLSGQKNWQQNPTYEGPFGKVKPSSSSQSNQQNEMTETQRNCFDENSISGEDRNSEMSDSEKPKDTVLTMEMVQQLKERLMSMSQELDRVKLAANKLNDDLGDFGVEEEKMDVETTEQQKCPPAPQVIEEIQMPLDPVEQKPRISRVRTLRTVSPASIYGPPSSRKRSRTRSSSARRRPRPR